MAKINVYEMVTDRILSELDKGNIPWHKPWIVPTVKYKGVKVEVDPKSCAYSRSTGRPYSLLNQMLLCRSGELLRSGDQEQFPQQCRVHPELGTASPR